MLLDQDAFASGQILSKLWLAETLEDVIKHENITNPLKILILGGWYGQLHLIFRIRKRLKIESTVSVDIDPEVQHVAELLNETWVWQFGKFSAVTADANDFVYSPADFNMVINTSVEHMHSTQWFDLVPQGMLTVLQSNNMLHDDHHNTHANLHDFTEEYTIHKCYYHGVKQFAYADFSFKRYMLIGRK